MKYPPGVPLVDPAMCQLSVLNLRDELIDRLAREGQFAAPEITELVFKINSCLFRQYPTVEKAPE